MAKVTIEFNTEDARDSEALVRAMDILTIDPEPADADQWPEEKVAAAIAEGKPALEIPTLPQATVPPLIPGGTNPVAPSAVLGAMPDAPQPAIDVAPTVELDTEGLPWDARIHAASRTRRQSDNTWKLKRNLADTAVAQIKAELRAAPVAPTTVPQATTPVPTPPTAVALATPPQPIADPPQPLTERNEDGSGGSLFKRYIDQVAAKVGSGELTMPQVEAACSAAGLAFPKDLSGRPDLIPQVAAALGVTI